MDKVISLEQSPNLRRDSLLILFAGIVIFTIALNDEFISSQVRFGLFAQEMLRNGPSFFPTTYDTPYPDYPATSTFLIYLASLPFGEVTAFTAILPTAITSALILLLTYQIGATKSRQVGWAGVLLALFTHQFFFESRTISLDQYNSLATILCFYIVYTATIYDRNKRLLFIPLILIAGFSFRGPIGIVIPTAVVCSYYLYRKEFKKLVLMAIVAAGLLAACSATLSALARFEGGEEFAQRVLHAQVTGRMAQAHVSRLYYLYCCVSSLAVACPLAILFVISNYKKIIWKKAADFEFIGYLTAWALIILVGMSIPADKKARYVVPVVPAVSLIAGYMIITKSLDGWLLHIRNAFLAFCRWLPMIGTVAAAGLLIAGIKTGFAYNIRLAVAMILLIGLSIASRKIILKLQDSQSRNLAALSSAVAAIIIITIGLAQPIMLMLESTKAFSDGMKLIQKERPGDIVFYRLGPDGEDIKFLVNYQEKMTFSFPVKPEELLEYNQFSYFVTDVDDFEELPAEIKKYARKSFEGKIGHKECVVFTMENVEEEPEGN